MSSISITHVPEILPQLKKETIRRIIEQGRRSDGRSFLEFRKITVRAGSIKTANGSAIVLLGNTKVVAGVKAEIGEPFKDTPDEGALIVNLETPPLASPTIEPGPPDENAIEIARIVDRTIRHSGFLDFKSLCIKPNEHVWILWVDLYVLNHDGNLIDAATIAAATALAVTELPRVTIEEGGKIKVDNNVRERLKVDLNKIPCTITFTKINNVLLVDPTLEEENICESKFTVGIADDKVVAIQKTLGIFSIDDIKFIVEKSMELYKNIREIMLKAIENPNKEFKV